MVSYKVADWVDETADMLVEQMAVSMEKKKEIQQDVREVGGQVEWKDEAMDVKTAENKVVERELILVEKQELRKVQIQAEVLVVIVVDQQEPKMDRYLVGRTV